MTHASLHDLTSSLSVTLIALIVAGIPLYAAFRRVPIYEKFIDGAKDGFDIAVRIIPHLVAMLVAIGMLEASGFFILVGQWLAPVLDRWGTSSDLVSLAFLRPLSGSASNALLNQIAHNHGGDSVVAKTAATMIGSTETTLYVIAVYFGAISIKHTRYALPVGLLADLSGIVAAITVCRYLL